MQESPNQQDSNNPADEPDEDENAEAAADDS
jgi:hypothetical protein